MSKLTCHCGKKAWTYGGATSLDGPVYARMFRDYGVPAAYTYEPGTHLHQTAVNRAFDELYVVIYERYISRDKQQHYAIVSDGTHWVFVRPSSMSEFAVHASHCEEKHNKEILIERCKQRGPGHVLKNSWKSPPGGGPYEITFTCSCGNTWIEYPEK